MIHTYIIHQKSTYNTHRIYIIDAERAPPAGSAGAAATGSPVDAERAPPAGSAGAAATGSRVPLLSFTKSPC